MVSMMTFHSEMSLLFQKIGPVLYTLELPHKLVMIVLCLILLYSVIMWCCRPKLKHLFPGFVSFRCYSNRRDSMFVKGVASSSLQWSTSPVSEHFFTANNCLPSLHGVLSVSF